MLDNKTLIPIVNKRSTAYTASLRNGEYFEWLPATESYEDSIDLPFRDVQYLHTQSATFRGGYLYVDDEEARKRLGLEREDVKANQLSRQEIEKALKGNITQLKKMLEKIENQSLFREVITIAKEIKLDNTNKLQIISEATGVPMEILIEQD